MDCVLCLHISSASHRPGSQADPTFPVGHPWHLSPGRTGGGYVDGAMRRPAWGWRSLSESPTARSEQATLSAPPGLSWLAAGAHTVPPAGRGGVAKVTPRWAGCGRRRPHHERPEAQLHLWRLRRVGASASAVRGLLGCGDPPRWGGLRRLRRASIRVVSGMSELPRALLGVHVRVWG